MTFGCELSECYFVHGDWGLSIFLLPLVMMFLYLVGALFVFFIECVIKRAAREG